MQWEEHPSMKMTTRSCLPRRLSESVVASVVARYQSIDRDAVLQGDQRWGWLVAVGVSHAFNAACQELIIRNGTESEEKSACALWIALGGALAVKTSQCLQMSRILWVNFNSCPFAHFSVLFGTSDQIILSAEEEADGDQTRGDYDWERNDRRDTENMR